MVWPFAARGARVSTVSVRIEGMPPFEAFLENNAVIKVWLPTKLSERVDWLSAHVGASRPDVLRGTLFEHVYGAIAMRQLEVFAKKRLEEIDIRFSRRQPDSTIKKSTPRNTNLEMLGKASDDFKLHLPQRLKDDLAGLAGIHRITTSHYVRKALVLELMGERFHADWQVALGKLGPMGADVEALERE
ncbi:MAG: hypothetical protein RL014_1807 [Pseudomonadota bacterium]|jgi:hypothetical protein